MESINLTLMKLWAERLAKEFNGRSKVTYNNCQYRVIIDIGNSTWIDFRGKYSEALARLTTSYEAIQAYKYANTHNMI